MKKIKKLVCKIIGHKYVTNYHINATKEVVIKTCVRCGEKEFTTYGKSRMW